MLPQDGPSKGGFDAYMVAAFVLLAVPTLLLAADIQIPENLKVKAVVEALEEQNGFCYTAESLM